MWDGFSFLIGLFIGIILILILILILYSTRLFIFKFTPTNYPPCRGGDYYNDPADAIANGYKVEDILSIKDGEMYYKRVQKISNCTPEENQIVKIRHPEYCIFNVDGALIQGQNGYFGSNVYSLKTGVSGAVVETLVNCIPKDDQIASSGKPQLLWDPAT
jgi:hypothetical protein